MTDDYILTARHVATSLCNINLLSDFKFQNRGYYDFEAIYIWSMMMSLERPYYTSVAPGCLHTFCLLVWFYPITEI
jgi:hypothetical protein